MASISVVHSNALIKTAMPNKRHIWRFDFWIIYQVNIKISDLFYNNVTCLMILLCEQVDDWGGSG